MNITRWEPFREVEEMFRQYSPFFAHTLRRNGGDVGEWAPVANITETDKEYLIKAELPEVKKEDVKVSVDNGILRIEGERKQEKEEKGKKFHRIERSYGSFLRTFTLPDNVDATKVRADFKDGLLNVRLPKTEQAKPKAIEIKVG